MRLAAREPPKQEGVDGAERKLAGLRRCASAFDAIEQPGDLGGGKIRINEKPGFAGDIRLVPVAAQRLAIVGGAAILPDDCVVDRPAALPVPDHHGFTLIGDADAGNVFCADASLRHRRTNGGHDRRPDLFGIVLDLARRRINLVQFLLRRGERPQLCVEDNRAGGGRALINRDECRRQQKSPAIIDGNSISLTSSTVQARPPALWTPAGRSCFAATIHRRRSAPIHFRPDIALPPRSGRRQRHCPNSSMLRASLRNRSMRSP